MVTTDSGVQSVAKLDNEKVTGSHPDIQIGSPTVQKKKVPNVISGSKASVDDQV